MKETLLKLKNVSVRYGGVQALEDVDISIDEGEFVALMGPNGAGKSTVLKAIFGIAPLAGGDVLWHEGKITPKAHEMVRRGVTFVPQGRQVFKSLTVYENLELGGYALPNKSDLGKNIQEVLRFFPALREKLHTKAGHLSGGQQQMLTIARGLVSDPKVLLLDEPSLGLSPKYVTEVFEKIKEINEARKIAVVVVEHSVKSVLEIVQRAYILAHGRVVLEKPAKDLMGTDDLERIFLAK